MSPYSVKISIGSMVGLRLCIQILHCRRFQTIDSRRKRFIGFSSQIKMLLCESVQLQESHHSDYHSVSNPTGAATPLSSCFSTILAVFEDSPIVVIVLGA